MNRAAGRGRTSRGGGIQAQSARPCVPQSETLEAVKMGDPIARFPVERLWQRLHPRDAEQPFLRQSTLSEYPLVW